MYLVSQKIFPTADVMDRENLHQLLKFSEQALLVVLQCLFRSVSRTQIYD